MEKPSFKLIRQELGETLKSLPGDELDREALKIWKERMKKYQQHQELEERKIENRVVELTKKYGEIA